MDHIFAAGDASGRWMVVQTARMEGRVAATNAILGPTRQATYDVVPSGSFTDPEYGRVTRVGRRGSAHRSLIGTASFASTPG